MRHSNANKIHILYVTTSLSGHGGIEETLRILCRYLDNRQFRIGICSIQDKPEQILAEFQHLDITLFGLNRNGAIYDLVTMLKIMQTIRHFQAHIVHTHNNKGNWHGRLAAYLYGGTAIITTHHDLGDSLIAKTKKQTAVEGNYKRAVNCMSRFIYPFCNILLNRLNSKVICVSNAVRQIYTKEHDPLFEVVHAPFDEHIFQPVFRKKRQRIVLGVVGRLVRQKGHFMLLHALTGLTAKYPTILLKIKGQGELEGSLKQFVSDHGLSEHVEFCGDRPHNAALYQDLNIYIQPSVSEGCSITLLEAMGSRIPVIATDSDGPAELITHGETGLLVPLQNPHALQIAISELIDHPEKSAALAEAGYQRAITHFSSRIFTDRMSTIYMQAANHVL